MQSGVQRVRSLCVFCASSFGNDPKWKEAAWQLGGALAKEGITTVYGGSHSGLMGQLAESALTTGGRVEGVIPKFFLPNEDPYAEVSELTVVDDMHSRKHLMFEKADAFCILPGGIGTLDETFEIMTWKQLQLHDRPILLVNLYGYWDPLLALIDRIVETGFAKTAIKSLYQVVNGIDEAMEILKTLPPGHPADVSRA